MFCIYDLDGTVICSNHRKATLPNGDLDLEHWIENNLPEKIAEDSLLPLIEWMRLDWRTNNIVLVCTARVLGDADYSFFMENDIPFHEIMSRPMGCNMADAQLKEIQLRLYAQGLGISWQQFCQESTVYDDNQSVIKHLRSIGMLVSDAVKFNRSMAA